MGGALLQTALLGYCLFETGRAGWQDELDLRNPTEALLLAAALSSTEGAGLVDESRFGRIHSLLHGEGVLNDPVSIVAFTALVRGTVAGDQFLFNGHNLANVAGEIVRS